MICKDITQKVDAYLGGEMDAASSAALRGHARTCQACTALIGAQRELVEGLGALQVPEPPAQLFHGIKESLANSEIQQGQKSPLRLMISRYRFALGALVPCALALGLVALWALRKPVHTEGDEGIAEGEVQGRIYPGLIAAGDLPSVEDRYRLSIDEQFQIFQGAITELQEFSRESGARGADERERVFEARWEELSMEDSKENSIASLASLSDPEFREHDSSDRYHDQIDLLQQAALGEAFQAWPNL